MAVKAPEAPPGDERNATGAGCPDETTAEQATGPVDSCPSDAPETPGFTDGAGDDVEQRIEGAEAPPSSPLAWMRIYEGEQLRHRRSLWRKAAEFGTDAKAARAAGDDDMGEMAILLNALAFYLKTGEIEWDVVFRVRHILIDAQKGHLHPALRPPRNRKPASTEELTEIAVALHYIHAADTKKQGFRQVEDPKPYKTVGSCYGVDRTEIASWQKPGRMPEEIRDMTIELLFMGPEDWPDLLALYGSSYRNRKERVRRKGKKQVRQN